MTDHLTPIHRRLIEAAAEVRLDAASEIEYQHGILCQVGLPRKKAEGRVFERSFKNASIEIEAGKLWIGGKWVEQPIPYGPKPRLALIHINSEAVRTQCPTIEIGHSVSDFLRRIGLDSGGYTYNLFKRQMMALAAMRMSIGFTLQGNGIAKDITIDTKPIKRFEAWLTNDARQTSLWPGQLQLSQEYFESLIEHAVPLDPRAIGALSHSALALDWYSFLSRRLHELERPVKIPFVSLQEQFGQEYRGKTAYSDFKKEFLKATKQVLAVYPDAKIECVTGGLVLNPSPPPIKAAHKSHRIAQEAKKLPAPADPTAQLAERTAGRFKELWPGLDVYACQADFDQWISRKAQQPKDYNRAFLGFAKKWAAKQNA